MIKQNSRLFNFCAGPAMLPDSVMLQMQAELLNWNHQGASVMEISHRSPAFEKMLEEVESDFRELLSIPNNYKVLFLQGGGYGQFSAMPMNLLGGKSQIDFIETGIWSAKAIECAKKYAKANVLYSSRPQNYQSISDLSKINASEESAYVYYCANETINGVEFEDVPAINAQDKLFVADMSSNILSRPIDFSKIGAVFASAQKNIGPSGVVIVIVREDLLDNALSYTPEILNFKLQSANQSMLNTPTTFSLYSIGLVLKWFKEQGGIQSIEQTNIKKADLLYQTIDNSDFYSNTIDKSYRSRMNVPFNLKDDQLNPLFINKAKESGIINIKGHRSVGGMRASIYNAMPIEGVVALSDFMKHFEKTI